MPIVRRTRTAQNDIVELCLYVAKNSGPMRSDALADSIELAILLLADNPKGGPLREDIGTRLRSWPVENILIFYRPMRNGVEVVRVIHGARDLRSVFRKSR